MREQQEIPSVVTGATRADLETIRNAMVAAGYVCTDIESTMGTNHDGNYYFTTEVNSTGGPDT